MPLIGCVDFWWDVTKIEPGPQQDAKIAEFSPWLKQLTASLDSNTPERMDAIAPKALFLVNSTQDRAIDIRSIRKFADEMCPRYEKFAERLDFFEDKKAGQTFSRVMKEKATQWLVRHLIAKPIRVSRDLGN